MQPGASVAKVARAHGVNANQVFAWRRRYRESLCGREVVPRFLYLVVFKSRIRASIE